MHEEVLMSFIFKFLKKLTNSVKNNRFYYLIPLTILNSLSFSIYKDIELLQIKECRTMSLDRNFLLALKNTFNITSFIETGTAYGGTVNNALPIFDTISSIEINKFLYEKNREKYINEKKVFLYNGQSHNILETALNNSSENILLWLDAHNTSEKHLCDAEKNCYLLDEINIIIQNKKASASIILIDDIRCSLWHLTDWQKLPTSISQLYYNIGKGWPSFAEIYNTLKMNSLNYSIGLLGDVLIAFNEKQFNVNMHPFAKECANILYGLSTKYKNDYSSSVFLNKSIEPIIFEPEWGELDEYRPHLNLLKFMYCINNNDILRAQFYKEKCNSVFCKPISDICENIYAEHIQLLEKQVQL
jgi:hypothetical protein